MGKKDDKALSRAELELTQKFQRDFPPGISPELLQAWIGCPQEIFVPAILEVFGRLPRGKRVEHWRMKNPYIKRLNDQPLLIRQTTGEMLISYAKGIFHEVGTDFSKDGLERLDRATLPTYCDIYEADEDCTELQIFGAFLKCHEDFEQSFVAKNRLKLQPFCLTQEQVVAFVEDHREWFVPKQDGDPVFWTQLMIEIDGCFRFVNIIVREDGSIDASYASYGFDHFGKGNRIVLPR